MFKIPSAEELAEKQREISSYSLKDSFETLKRKRDGTEEKEKEINVVPVAMPIVSRIAQIVSAPLIPKRAQSTILVNANQKGNTLLKHIKNVRWEHSDIPCDYLLSAQRGSIYLSLKYHKLHPDYVYSRMNTIKDSYAHLIILCLVDIPDHEESVREITKVGYIFGATILLAWSHEESARYLEMYLAYQNKPMDSIKEKVDPDYLSKLTDTLTSVKSVNKTDVITLSTTFGSLRKMSSATMDQLVMCPGMGEQKAKRLIDAFKTPFNI